MSTELSPNQVKQKTRLSYFEFHLTEHCNMNCKGCGHFSCLAEPEFTDLEQNIKDMQRLSELVDFEIVKLLGGEPLLHPQVNEFMKVARKFFPKSIIAMTTNAILLPAMKQDFWDTVVENNIRIHVSLYKPMFEKKQQIIDLLNDHNINGEIREVQNFFKRIDFTGSQDYLESFKNCKYKDCRFLESGRIATCCLPFMVRHANKNFFLKMDENDEGIIDIHDPKLTSEDLVKRLDKPLKICKYCTIPERFFEWDFTKKDLSEWFFYAT